MEPFVAAIANNADLGGDDNDDNRDEEGVAEAAEPEEPVPEPGPAQVGGKRKRVHAELTSDQLVSLRASRLEGFDKLVSGDKYTCYDHSAAAKKLYGEKGQLRCLACKSIISLTGGTGNVSKHNGNTT